MGGRIVHCGATVPVSESIVAEASRLWFVSDQRRTEAKRNRRKANRNEVEIAFPSKFLGRRQIAELKCFESMRQMDEIKRRCHAAAAL